jgi:sirohydrochlorin ferrochelatase
VAPTLLLAVHGTRSIDGRATLDELAGRVRAARAGLELRLCFLDVLEPDLPTALSSLAGPVVVVPALLSRGYHVNVDVPGVVADRSNVAIAGHLGPDPLVVRALTERLRDAADPLPEQLALVGTGSSDPTGYDDLTAAAEQLGAATGRPVAALTSSDDLAGELAELRAVGPVAVASYVLAEGFFARSIRAAAAAAGVETVSAPLGAHPALVELILQRYDAIG